MLVHRLESSPALDVQIIRSREDLLDARAAREERRVLERMLGGVLAEREAWTLPGACRVCSALVGFLGDSRFSWGQVVNFREHLVCPQCGLNARARFVAHMLLETTRGQPDEAIHVFEQTTRFFAWARRALPGTVTGSEYLGPDVPNGSVVKGIRHEDALALSFADASLDALVSKDVFEHVPDIERALAESARVLRPGGTLFFSVPFGGRETTVQRAAIRHGEVVHLHPPRYHDNPLDPLAGGEGSLVFYDHGWDLLDRCRAAGFADAYALGYWSALWGYLGDGLQVTFLAHAPNGG